MTVLPLTTLGTKSQKAKCPVSDPAFTIIQVLNSSDLSIDLSCHLKGALMLTREDCMFSPGQVCYDGVGYDHDG